MKPGMKPDMAKEPSPLPPARVRGSLLFWLARFWGLAACFYLLDRNPWFQRVLVEPYALLSSRLAGYGLLLLGAESRIAGDVVEISGHNFRVAGCCTGSMVFLLLAALVLTYPVSWKRRLFGVGAGFVSISLLNILRILLIVILASRFPATFWGMHIIIGQALIIAGTLATFICWAREPENEPERALILPRSAVLGRATALYVAGFLVSYGLYALFLTSPPGEWLRRLIIHHATVVVGLLSGSAAQHGEVIHTARNSIRVVHSCLSSPVLVLFLAAIFLLPLSRGKRAFLYLSSFLPLYYLYHLLRTVFLVLFLTGDRNLNFAYNFFGHLVLVPALLGFSVYYWCGIRHVSGCKEQFMRLGIGFVVGGVVAGIAYCFWQEVGLEWLRAALGVAGPFYDHGRLMRLMPAVHLLLWGSLVWSTPYCSRIRRLLWLAGGAVVWSLFYAVLITAISRLGLHPHHWLLKMLNLGPPLLAYFVLVPGRVELDDGGAEASQR